MAETKTFIKWSPNYTTKIPEIDEQHQKLVEMINQLYSAFVKGQHEDTIYKVIDEMAAYTDYHFKTEENYFNQTDFPDKEEHIEKHNNFICEVEKFKSEFKKNPKALTYKVTAFLQKWLVEHILADDKKYVPYILKK